MAAFSQLDSAQALKDALGAGMAYPVSIASQALPESAIHRVRIGPLPDYATAQAARKVKRRGRGGDESEIWRRRVVPEP